MIRFVIQDGWRDRRNRFSNELHRVSQSHAFGRLRAAVAYVTLSGLDVIRESVELQGDGVTHWLVSIDFGRTEPDALRMLHNLGEVRVHDGSNVILRPHLRPNIVYHPKSFVFDNPPAARPVAVVCGSANTTSSGVAFGVEHISSRTVAATEEPIDWLSDFNHWWEIAWESATVVSDDFIDKYEEVRSNLLAEGQAPPDEYVERTVGSRSASDTRRQDELVRFQRWAASSYFFMDVGAAGANLPGGGNQLDAPRGARVFLDSAPKMSRRIIRLAQCLFSTSGMSKRAGLSGMGTTQWIRSTCPVREIHSRQAM